MNISHFEPDGKNVKEIINYADKLFHGSENEKLKANLLNSGTNFLINEYMKQLFMGLMHTEFSNDIDNHITEIMKITSNNREMVIKKCLCLVDNFYKYLERPKLKASNYDKYKDSFIISPTFYSDNNIEFNSGILPEKNIKQKIF